MKEDEAIKRMEQQIRKYNLIDYDPTTTLLNKFQKEVALLKSDFHLPKKIVLFVSMEAL